MARKGAIHFPPQLQGQVSTQGQNLVPFFSHSAPFFVCLKLKGSLLCCFLKGAKLHLRRADHLTRWRRQAE